MKGSAAGRARKAARKRVGGMGGARHLQRSVCSGAKHVTPQTPGATGVPTERRPTARHTHA